jgi:hypothetical protein
MVSELKSVLKHRTQAQPVKYHTLAGIDEEKTKEAEAQILASAKERQRKTVETIPIVAPRVEKEKKENETDDKK